MDRSVRTPSLWWMLLLTTCPTGCAGLPHTPPLPTLAANASSLGPLGQQPVSSLRQVSFDVSAPDYSSLSVSEPEGPLLGGMSEISVEALVEQVVARNPSLTQMTAAWQAAAARYPQVTALDDPMLGATIGPASIGSNEVDFAYRLEVSQKLPFCGKRWLRGQSARAEAAAAGNEVDDMHLQLIESA